MRARLGLSGVDISTDTRDTRLGGQANTYPAMRDAAHAGRARTPSARMCLSSTFFAIAGQRASRERGESQSRSRRIDVRIRRMASICSGKTVAPVLAP